MELFKDFYLKIKPEPEFFTEDNPFKMPQRANQGDAGIDVFSPGEYMIYPGRDVKIPLGFRVEFPRGFVMLFRNKSGRATNDKLMVGAEVVDSEYRGIVHAHIFNFQPKGFTINAGEKVCQFLILPCWEGQPEQVEEINMETDRGTGGFGSSGLQ